MLPSRTQSMLHILLILVCVATPLLAEKEAPFPCTAPEFNTSTGYKPTTERQALSMLNIAADAFEKWLNNGENKSISCTPQSISGFSVNVTNSCSKVTEEGTSYALDFKTKFDCLNEMLNQVSANVQLQAEAQRPNVTIGGAKAATVISSVRFVDGLEFDRVVIQEIIVRQLAPAPGPMMKEIQDNLQHDVANGRMLPLSKAPKGAPGPSQGALQERTGDAMLPMPLPMASMANLAVQQASALTDMLSQATSVQPLSLADTEDASDVSASASGVMSALANVLTSLAQTSARSESTQTGQAQAAPLQAQGMDLQDAQEDLSDRAMVMAANQPLRAERVSQRPNPYLISQQLANQDMAASSRVHRTEAQASADSTLQPEGDWSAQPLLAAHGTASRIQGTSSKDDGSRKLLSARF